MPFFLLRLFGFFPAQIRAFSVMEKFPDQAAGKGGGGYGQNKV
jgi:hypothetical protein